jgi:hypothetical protein
VITTVLPQAEFSPTEALKATLPAARRRGVWHALATARCVNTSDLPAVAFTSDYSRPGFLRMGFLPITRFTLWAVAT